MGVIKIEDVQNKIVKIQGQKVLLDSDVAELYEVETKRINEAVRNNPDKFPYGYIVELSKNEWDLLKSKFSTSKICTCWLPSSKARKRFRLPWR